MFGPKYIQGCIFAFVILTLLSGIFDGVYLGSADYGVIKTLTWWSSQSFGIFTVPLVLGSFVAALPQMLTWDYSFFASLGSAGSIIRLLLFAIVSIGFVWGFFSIMLPAAMQIFGSMIRGITGLIGRL